MRISPVLVLSVAAVAVTTVAVWPHASPRRSGLTAPPSLYVSATGADNGVCSQASPCASLNGAYQIAKPGDVVSVQAGTYQYQAINPRPDLRNLSPGCTTANPGQCVRFVLSGVKINGQLNIYGSDVFIDGGTDRTNPGLDATGNISTDTGSSCCAPPTTYPDHLVLQGTHSATFGIHATDTLTWRDFDVGPATVSTGCNVKEGPGSEDAIGISGIGPVFVPTSIVLDGMRLHNQNGDAQARPPVADCHWGGLFLINANGLLVENSIFERNVVYNVEVQNFVGPPSTNVTWKNDSFGCPVEWTFSGDVCDGQASIQFDGTFLNHTITSNVFAEPSGFGCYRTPCDFSTDTFTGNAFVATSTTAPPLPGPLPTPTTTPTTTTAPTTTTTTPTVGQWIDRAAAEFKATTISYPTWAARVKSGYYKTDPSVSTAWGRGFDDLTQARKLTN